MNQKKLRTTLITLITLTLAATTTYYAINLTQPQTKITQTKLIPRNPEAGKNQIQITFNKPIENTTLKQNNQTHQPIQTQNNTLTFNYYLAPEPEQQTLHIQTPEKTFNKTINLTKNYYINQTNNTTLYSTQPNPLKKIRDTLNKTKKINFFFKLHDKSPENTKIIQAYIPLIKSLASTNKTIRTYGMNKNTCRTQASNRTQTLNKQECLNILRQQTSIYQQLPEYSFQQISVENNTIRIQSSLKKLEKTNQELTQLIHSQ